MPAVIAILIVAFGLVAFSAANPVNQANSFTDYTDTGSFSDSARQNYSSVDNSASVGNADQQRDSDGSIIAKQLIQVETVSAQDITDRSARLRGDVDMGRYRNGIVFFVYGYSEELVSGVERAYAEHGFIDDQTSDRLRASRVDNSAHDAESYEEHVSQLINDTEYFFQLCVFYENDADVDVVTCGGVETFNTDDRNNRSNNKIEPRASTDKATYIEFNQATLNGRVDMNDFFEGIAFFVYGEDREKVRNVDLDFDTYSSIREDDENFQKTRVGTDLRGRSSYEHTVDDLDNGTTHFFQMCVEYDGDRDGIECGGVREFTTDSSKREDTPDTFTGNASDITDREAKIEGDVDMNDFFDGLVFFVYGTDRALVSDVINEDAFSDVRQSGDRLQRVAVDSDLDGRDNYPHTVRGLLTDTEYAYRICVEYENEDKDGRDALFLACGDVKDFVTDTN